MRERYSAACKKNTPGLVTILYRKNSSEECFMGFKAHARDVLSNV